jgi:hypothetical protein
MATNSTKIKTAIQSGGVSNYFPLMFRASFEFQSYGAVFPELEKPVPLANAVEDGQKYVLNKTPFLDPVR